MVVSKWFKNNKRLLVFQIFIILFVFNRQTSTNTYLCLPFLPAAMRVKA